MPPDRTSFVHLLRKKIHSGLEAIRATVYCTIVLKIIPWRNFDKIMNVPLLVWEWSILEGRKNELIESSWTIKSRDLSL